MGISTNLVKIVHDPVAKRRKGRAPFLRKKPKKFMKSRMDSARFDAKVSFKIQSLK